MTIGGAILCPVWAAHGNFLSAIANVSFDLLWVVSIFTHQILLINMIQSCFAKIKNSLGEKLALQRGNCQKMRAIPQEEPFVKPLSMQN